MRNTALVTGVICLLLAVIVIIFADGPRRIYSGSFFILLSVVMLWNTRRWHKLDKED